MWKKRIKDVDFLGKLCDQNYYYHCRIIDMLTKGTKSDVINDREVREWPTLLTTVLIQTLFSCTWFVLYWDSNSGQKKITPATRQEEYQTLRNVIAIQFSFVCMCLFSTYLKFQNGLCPLFSFVLLQVEQSSWRASEFTVGLVTIQRQTALVKVT